MRGQQVRDERTWLIELRDQTLLRDAEGSESFTALKALSLALPIGGVVGLKVLH